MYVSSPLDDDAPPLPQSSAPPGGLNVSRDSDDVDWQARDSGVCRVAGSPGSGLNRCKINIDWLTMGKRFSGLNPILVLHQYLK